MTKQEREEISTAWAEMMILCGVVDPESPEEDFPNGRLITAHKKATEIFIILEKVMGHRNRRQKTT